MDREFYEKPVAEVVMFDLNEVYMLATESGSNGEDGGFGWEEEEEGF